MLNIRGSLVFYQILFLKVCGMQMCDIVWYPSHLCNWYSTSQLSTRGSGPNILVFDISKLQQSREAAGQRLFLAVLPRRRRPMLQPFSKLILHGYPFYAKDARSSSWRHTNMGYSLISQPSLQLIFYISTYAYRQWPKHFQIQHLGNNINNNITFDMALDVFGSIAAAAILP